MHRFLRGASFPNLYDPTARAWAEMGRLVIDNRTFHLAVLVENRAHHASIARNASMYVMYLQIRRVRDAVLYEVAVPVTAGGRGNLIVGKRGIFIDRSDDELDAEIVEIIDNPISTLEAIVSPVSKLARTITGKFESLTTEADQQLQQFAGSAVESIGRPATQPAPAVDTQRSVGTAILGGSVAVAALGSAVAYITTTVASMRWWQIAVGFGGALSAVVVPAVVLALLKLRRRDLSSILEASGWSLNIPMKLTRRLQKVFTARPDYPRGASGSPLVRRRRGVLALLALVLIVGAGIGLVLLL